MESIWWTTLNSDERNELQIDTAEPFPEPDLLVLGGNLIGLATAYFYAERGARVQLLTAAPQAGTEAEASLGCIIPNACAWQFSEVTQPLAQASRDWWAKLAVRPEFQIDWRVTGALVVDPERLVPSARQQMLAGLEAGYSLHDVDEEQISLLEPALAACPAGGLHYPSEAVIHPLRAALGFVRGLRRRGGQVLAGRIVDLTVSSGRVKSLEATAGIIRPKSVFVSDPVLVSIPQMGQLAVNERNTLSSRTFLASAPQPPLLKRPVLDANWIVQLKSGEFVLEVEQSDTSAIDQTVERARRLIPALAGVEFERVWSGLSQTSGDRAPVIDRWPNIENVWYCRNLNFGEALFGPIIGKSVADWIQTGQPAEELTAFAERGVVS